MATAQVQLPSSLPNTSTHSVAKQLAHLPAQTQLPSSLTDLAAKQPSTSSSCDLHFFSHRILRVTVSAPISQACKRAHTHTHRRVNKHRNSKLYIGLTLYIHYICVWSRAHCQVSQDAPKHVHSPAEHTHVHMHISQGQASPLSAGGAAMSHLGLASGRGLTECGD